MDLLQLFEFPPYPAAELETLHHLYCRTCICVAWSCLSFSLTLSLWLLSFMPLRIVCPLVIIIICQHFNDSAEVVFCMWLRSCLDMARHLPRFMFLLLHDELVLLVLLFTVTFGCALCWGVLRCLFIFFVEGFFVGIFIPYPNQGSTL